MTYIQTDNILNEIQQDQELKDIIKACGATKLNSYPARQTQLQTLARLNLLAEITLYHAGKDTLSSDMKYQISLHRDAAKSTYETLDNNNTIEHLTPAITEWRKYMAENSAKLIKAELFMPVKPKTENDEITKHLLLVQSKSRASYMKQRIHNALETAHQKGWFVVFDTLTLAPDKVQAFYDDETAIRDYCQKIGREVLHTLGLSKKTTYTPHYQYICVPEYGTKNGRLHFHLIHLMEALPHDQKDPNFGRPSHARHMRELRTFKKHWNYSANAQHMPLCVRYAGDAYGARLRWLMPIDKATALPIELKPLIAVGHYVAKYISKSQEQDHIKKGLGESKWNSTLRRTLNSIPTHSFRIRMSRGFGMNTPSMTALPSEVLAQLTRLHWSVSPLNKVIKENAKKELKSRMGKILLSELPRLLPNVTNLLKLLRSSMKGTHEYNQQNSGDIMTPSLVLTDVSNHTLAWLTTHDLLRETKVQSKITLAGK